MLTATWTANATDTYSYSAGTGSGTAPAAGSGLDGTTIVLAANTSASRLRLQRLDRRQRHHADLATYTLATRLGHRLDRQWTANATDAYSYAAGTGSGTAPAAGSGLDGTTIVLAANTFSEPGYTFAGWSDGSATYAAGATYTSASTARPSS